MEYESPVTVDDALAIMQKTKGNIQLLAGGTDLLVQMQSQTVDPEIILDVKNIKEMTEIKKVDNKFMIGAAVSGMEIIDHKDFSETWPGVVDGVKLIGSIQIKGRASMGGNLCNASPAADSIPAMISSDANAYIVGPNGSREVPVEDFITGPGKNSLQTNEILLAIKFPEKRLNSSGAYLRFTPRTEMDIAVAGVGVNVALGSSGNIESAKIAIGAVAEKALLVEDAARELIGKSPSDEVMEAYINQVRIAARPIDDKRGTVDFRKQVIGVLAHRALNIALERIRNG